MTLLFFLMASLVWGFITESLLYSPLEKIQSAEKEPEGKKITKADFKAAWGAVIYKNNLFSPKRGAPPVRPPSETVVTPPPAPQEKPKPPPVRPVLKLNGIIVNQYGEYVAYIVKNAESAVRAREGDTLGDVKVVSIDERTVKLLWLNEEIVLSLSQIEELTR
jgi:hypothetical protein